MRTRCPDRRLRDGPRHVGTSRVVSAAANDAIGDESGDDADKASRRGGTVPTDTGANTIAAAPLAPIPVAQVSNPKQTLAGATVKDDAGAKVGEVKAVRLTADGKVASVSVSVGTRTVALQPSRLKYLQAENTITSDQSGPRSNASGSRCSQVARDGHHCTKSVVETLVPARVQRAQRRGINNAIAHSSPLELGTLLTSSLTLVGCADDTAVTEGSDTATVDASGSRLPRRRDEHAAVQEPRHPRAQDHDVVARGAGLLQSRLPLLFNFNHAAADLIVQEALKRDPKCAMCWWGIALAHGPNINMPMMPDAMTPAWQALQMSQSLSANASPAERDYIDALAKRYAEKPPQDRAPPRQGVRGGAMRDVAKNIRPTSTREALYAESLMDTSPWNYWQTDKKTPNAGLEDLAPTLEARSSPKRRTTPGAIHLYIHAVKVPFPKKAEARQPPDDDDAGRGPPRAYALAHLQPRRPLRRLRRMEQEGRESRRGLLRRHERPRRHVCGHVPMSAICTSSGRRR